jgi:hypothetical protein
MARLVVTNLSKGLQLLCAVGPPLSGTIAQAARMVEFPFGGASRSRTPLVLSFEIPVLLGRELGAKALDL